MYKDFRVFIFKRGEQLGKRKKKRVLGMKIYLLEKKENISGKESLFVVKL